MKALYAVLLALVLGVAKKLFYNVQRVIGINESY